MEDLPECSASNAHSGAIQARYGVFQGNHGRSVAGQGLILIRTRGRDTPESRAADTDTPLDALLQSPVPRPAGRPAVQGQPVPDALRQWPALLGILALAVIVTVSAEATIVYAKVLSRLAHRDGPGVRPQD